MEQSEHTVDEVAKSLVKRLIPLYGEGEAKAIMRLIFHNLKGWDTTQLIINSDQPLSEYMQEQIDKIVTRLLDGEPIQYILGEGRFYGLDLKVTPAVLIPRPETEELVDLIIKENPKPDLRVLDIGTGSGAIALALARNLKFPQILAIDVSADAVEVARENARNLKVNVRIERQDVFTWNPRQETESGPFREGFDIIVSNPPYIAESEKAGMERNVLDFEPHGALFVPDADPLRFYRRIAEIGLEVLVAGGRLYFEINPLFSGELKTLLTDMGYDGVEILPDISRRARFAKAIRE